MGWPKGIPDTRDHSRANYRGVDLWVAENQGKHFCRCGCGGVIQILAWMHAKTQHISEYLPHHYFSTPEFVRAQAERASKRVGKKAHNYKHGKTRKQEVLRKSKLYVAWRTAVFQRDHYTCQQCGARCGQGKAVRLHAHHHKIPFRQLWKEFMRGERTKASLFDISLGITLCLRCHRQIHFRT